MRHDRPAVRIWSGDREKMAILEIFHSTRNQAELEAVAALLGERGKYEKLFSSLDEHIFDLLQMLGELEQHCAIRIFGTLLPLRNALL